MSGCDVDRLEALVEGRLDEVSAAAARAHLAACARCAEEVSWLHAERRLFEARAASPAAEGIAALPPLSAVLAAARPARSGGSLARIGRRAPWVGLAVAARSPRRSARKRRMEGACAL